jgi:glycosyltransferase involved in cell wall biosynthesis
VISFVVPAYNEERCLPATLEAIHAAARALGLEYEIVVADDASTDATPAIIASYGDRLRHLRQETNRGIYDNVNVGIAAARGELIATYHADDIYEPTIVAREVEYLERHPDVGAVFALDTFVDAAGREYGRLVLPGEVRGASPLDYATTLNALLANKNRFLICPSAMVRASVHAAVGVYRQDVFRNTSDLEMWLRIAQRYRIGIVEEHLMRYRHFHGNSSQRYRHLKTAPENYFRIMDLYLANGGSAVATPRALTDYEAHRAEDRLMAAVSHYIMKEPAAARTVLNGIRMRPVWGSGKVQRARLTTLYLLLQALTRLPHVKAIADAFYRRWHVKQPPHGA